MMDTRVSQALRQISVINNANFGKNQLLKSLLNDFLSGSEFDRIKALLLLSINNLDAYNELHQATDTSKGDIAKKLIAQLGEDYGIAPIYAKETILYLDNIHKDIISFTDSIAPKTASKITLDNQVLVALKEIVRRNEKNFDQWLKTNKAKIEPLLSDLLPRSQFRREKFLLAYAIVKLDAWMIIRKCPNQDIENAKKQLLDAFEKKLGVQQQYALNTLEYIVEVMRYFRPAPDIIQPPPEDISQTAIEKPQPPEDVSQDSVERHQPPIKKSNKKIKATIVTICVIVVIVGIAISITQNASSNQDIFRGSADTERIIDEIEARRDRIRRLEQVLEDQTK